MKREGPAPDHCERCGTDFWWNDVPTPVVDASGTHHEHVTESDPGARLWCPDCWHEKQIERRTSQNRSLATVGSNGGEQQ
jgi:uncharacterized Zn ribbon protein